MGVYPSDNYVFVLSITNPDGSNPVVITEPTLTVVNAVTGSVVTAAQAMVAIPGTQKVYTYVWDTTGLQDGTYLGLVSYATADATVQGRLLKAVRLGDSRITGVVALDSSVAKDETVAKDATVMKFSDYVLPQNDEYVQAIYSKTQLIPTNPATADDLTVLADKLEDIHDFVVGTWTVNKANNTMTLFRKDGSILQSFTLEITSTESNRLRA